MGKGARARKAHKSENKHVLRARATAKHFHTIALTIGVLMLIAWALILIMQVITQATMNGNLQSGVYANESPDEIARLTTILPMGAIAVSLITVGLLFFFVLTCVKKPWLSLIGWGVALVGAAFFVVFFLEIQSLFPYVERQVGSTVIGKGLDFTTMLVRYYSAALPLLLPVPVLVFALRAKKYREIADVMECAAEERSTLSLGEADE